MKKVTDPNLNRFVRKSLDRNSRKVLSIRIPWFNSEYFDMDAKLYIELVNLYMNVVVHYGENAKVRLDNKNAKR